MFKMIRFTAQLVLVLAASIVVAKNSGKFPKNFLFGAGTSSYQTEGAWNEDGKGESIWDKFVHQIPSKIFENQTGDIACDSYHKYKEDVAIAKSLGLNHYRFSISWPRIVPNGTGNSVNNAGLNHYKSLVAELVKNDIIPVVTLFHWDFPQTLEDVGGLMNVSFIEPFVHYARVVIAALPEVPYWITFNEPRSICLYGYAKGRLAPATQQNVYQCAYVLVKAHAEVYHMYKQEFSHYKAPMGIVVDTQWSEPKTNSSEDIEAAERRIQFENGLYLNPIFNGNWPTVVIQRTKFRDQLANSSKIRLPKFTDAEINRIKGTYDYLGINYYYANLIANVPESNSTVLDYDSDVRVDVGVDPNWIVNYLFPVTPFGLRKVLNWLKHGFQNPRILISESGFADDGRLNDDSRINFTRQYLNALLDAIEEDDVKVFGYTQWSLIDNFEWLFGYSNHFGLYFVNFTDPNRPRIPKKSAVFYKQLTETHQIPQDKFD